MEKFVQNVVADQQGRDHVEEALETPTYNFSRHDGNDVASDGHNADGRTPGDPRTTLRAVDQGAKRFTPPKPPNIYGNGGGMETMECPQCGFAFTPMAEKPLLLPETPISNAERHMADQRAADEADDGGFADHQPVMNCPRCGASM